MVAVHHVCIVLEIVERPESLYKDWLGTSFRSYEEPKLAPDLQDSAEQRDTEKGRPRQNGSAITWSLVSAK